MISFRVKDKKYVEDLLSNLKVISFAESFRWSGIFNNLVHLHKHIQKYQKKLRTD